MLRIGIVAGEHSGDQLGAGLLRVIRQQLPNVQVEGILGPGMLAESGGVSLFPMQALAVMGLVEVIDHYFDLTYIRHQVKLHFLQNPPDIFIGIDAPDFNLGLESDLRRAGIKTVHYVSPSVWAWRKGRVHSVAQAADRLLTLLPFEAQYYQGTGLHVDYVGHPLADSIAMETDTTAARVRLGLPDDRPVFAFMPGSRRAELERHSPVFVAAAEHCRRQLPDLHCIAGLADSDSADIFRRHLCEHAVADNFTLVTGDALTVMAAADAVLLPSGTVALECLLLKKPMVVAYKLAPISYYILRLLVTVPHISLPNILSGRTLVPEFLQQAATPAVLGQALLDWCQSAERSDQYKNHCIELHQQLRRDTNHRAAQSVLELCRS